MLTLRRALSLIVLVATGVAADSAALRVVTERSFPDGWTEPKVTTDQGASSYAPSVPSGFTTRDVGAVLDVGSATVHTSGRISAPEAVSARIAYRYRLLLPGCISVVLTPGTWKSIGADAVCLTRLPSGGFALQYRNTGRILRLRPQAGATGAGRPASR